MRHKIILSFIAIALLVVTGLVGTWAAFDSLEAYASNIQFEALSNGYTTISVDGVNFTEDLTNADMTKAIVAKYKNYTFDADGRYIDEAGILQDLDEDDIREIFAEITLNPLTSLNGTNFFYENSMGYQSEILVSSGLFVEFDLIFRSEVESPFNLYFNTDEINYDLNETTLSITSEEIQIDYDTLDTSFNYYDLSTGAGLGFNYFTNLSMSAKDAIRFSTETESNGTKIYEPNLGLGSYATDLDRYRFSSNRAYAARYDSEVNAAFTYARNHGLWHEPMAFEDMPEVYQDMSDMDALTVCGFERYHQTETVKFRFWLEGYDADCFAPIIGSGIKVSLSFRGSNNLDTYQINYHTGTPDGDDDEVITKTYINSPISVGNDPILLKKNNYVLGAWYADPSLTTYFDFEEVILTQNQIRDAYPYWNNYQTNN